eukprot:jgi/Picre1/35245/NNA_002707.t1
MRHHKGDGLWSLCTLGASRNRRHSLVVTRATVGCEALITSSWGIWATLACVGASALHIERSKWGKGFNAALLATVLGLVVSNLNIVPLMRLIFMGLSTHTCFHWQFLFCSFQRSGSGKENDKPSSVADGETQATDRIADPTISVIDGATAIGISALLCAAGSAIAQSIGYKGGSVAIITLLTVLFATFAPSSFLTPGMIASGESLGAILLQIFFASVGASGSLSVVVQTAPWLFAWSAVAVQHI